MTRIHKTGKRGNRPTLRSLRKTLCDMNRKRSESQTIGLNFMKNKTPNQRTIINQNFRRIAREAIELRKSMSNEIPHLYQQIPDVAKYLEKFIGKNFESMDRFEIDKIRNTIQLLKNSLQNALTMFQQEVERLRYEKGTEP